MGQFNFKTPLEFHSFKEYFTAAWLDSGTQTWVFLYNVNMQKPF